MSDKLKAVPNEDDAQNPSDEQIAEVVVKIKKTAKVFGLLIAGFTIGYVVKDLASSESDEAEAEDNIPPFEN